MLASNALAVARMVAVAAATGGGSGGASSGRGGVIALGAEDIPFCSIWWFVYVGISCVLVLFAGIMSGLTLGLMSLGLVELEILQRSGTPTEKQQAATILPVVQKQHQLLVTLLLCNSAAMEALPIFLDKIFHPVVAVILSVTFVLAFGEVIPQAICTRYGLAVGANFVWLVRILMIICYPVAYPIGKFLRGEILGKGDRNTRQSLEDSEVRGSSFPSLSSSPTISPNTLANFPISSKQPPPQDPPPAGLAQIPTATNWGGFCHRRQATPGWSATSSRPATHPANSRRPATSTRPPAVGRQSPTAPWLFPLL
ncbi:hypothetical protein M5K25_010641 [Dendrobium thyrsiflorum]|uniref:CNNM transmembrane domain-containing protein n=1 Tax=Dendrobium thyrsiflorum TaxID=117978 RepID=A0ABD0V1R2_DENTH